MPRASKMQASRGYVPPFDLPDYRNIERGREYLRRMIEASEAMDSGEKSSMNDVIDDLAPAEIIREREPGEDDD